MDALLGSADTSNQGKTQRAKHVYKPRRPFRTVEGIEDSAYEMLSPHAVWVLMEFYRKFDGYNRHCLWLSYREVKGKMANGTFSKSIRELIGFGFIDVTRRGRLERNNSLYALSHRWQKLSKDPEKLNKIQKQLTRVEKVKRIKTPKHLSDEDRTCFRLRRKQLLWKTRGKVSQGKGDKSG